MAARGCSADSSVGIDRHAQPTDIATLVVATQVGRQLWRGDLPGGERQGRQGRGFGALPLAPNPTSGPHAGDRAADQGKHRDHADQRVLAEHLGERRLIARLNPAVDHDVDRDDGADEPASDSSDRYVGNPLSGTSLDVPSLRPSSGFVEVRHPATSATPRCRGGRPRPRRWRGRCRSTAHGPPWIPPHGSAVDCAVQKEVPAVPTGVHVDTRLVHRGAGGGVGVPWLPCAAGRDPQ